MRGNLYLVLRLMFYEPNVHAKIDQFCAYNNFYICAGWPSSGGSFSRGRGRGRGFARGGRIGYGSSRRPVYEEPRFIRGPRKYSTSDRPLHEDRPRIRPPHRGLYFKLLFEVVKLCASLSNFVCCLVLSIPTAEVVPLRPSRGHARSSFGHHEEPSYSLRPNYEYSSSRGRGGRSSRRGRGAPSREEYNPRGGRASGFPRGRGYSSRPPVRDEVYPRRPGRGHSYDRNVDPRYDAGVPDYRDVGPGMKRPYAAMVGLKSSHQFF